MLRVAEIITQPDLGGGQVHLRELLAGLRSKVEFHVVVGSEGYLTERCAALGVPVHVAPALVRNIDMRRDVKAIRQVGTILEELQPDLLHAHTAKAGIAGRLSGWRLSIPTIYTPHGFSFSGRGPAAVRLISWGVEMGLRATRSEIIVLSRYERELARRAKVSPEKRIHWIPNGMPDVEKRADAGRPGVPTAIMVARFAPPKDYETLLRATAKARVPLKLRLVGEGPLLGSLRRLACELNLEGVVEFAGERPRVEDEFASAQIAVLSSNSEALPLSVIEAMRAGLPVIATDVEGIRDQVEHGRNGLLFQARDSDSLAESLTLLASDPESRRRLGQEGRRMFEERFSSDRMIQQTLALYEAVSRRDNAAEASKTMRRNSEGLSGD